MTTTTTTRKARPGGRRVITCRSCSKQRRHQGHDLCNPCWQRWNRAGRPDQVPAPLSVEERARLAREAKHAAMLARIDDYLFLRQQGLKHVAIAQRLGISKRAVEKYAAWLRQNGSPV